MGGLVRMDDFAQKNVRVMVPRKGPQDQINRVSSACSGYNHTNQGEEDCAYRATAGDICASRPLVLQFRRG